MRMAAYCRVSTDKEEQLSSLENQRTFFSQYAEKCGDTLVGIYADEGISGKSMKKRSAFLRLLRDSERGAFDYVAVKDISRFARNTSDFLYGIRTLRKNGVDVRFLSGNQTVLGESEFVLTVFAALAQEESANLSKRVIFGKRQNAKKGRVPNVIYGYDKIDTYTLRINSNEGEIVKLIFKWYISGDGTRRIAARLCEMGIPTKKGGAWTARTVRRILENTIYIGLLTNNKSVTSDFLSGERRDLPRGEWFVHKREELRLVSDGDFEKAQSVLAERRETYKSGGGRFSGKHVFSNLIKCAVCGGSFTAKSRGGGKCVRYRCRRHSESSVLCGNGASLKEEELLGAVRSYLVSLFDDGAEYEELRSGAEYDADGLERARKNLLARMGRLKELYVAEIIGMAELKDGLAAAERGLKEIESQIAPPPVSARIDELIASHRFTNDDMRVLVSGIIADAEKTEIFFRGGEGE